MSLDLFYMPNFSPSFKIKLKMSLVLFYMTSFSSSFKIYFNICVLYA